MNNWKTAQPPRYRRRRMGRRELMLLLGGAAVARPLTVRAEQSGMPMVGVLTNGSAATRRPFVVAFLQGLAEAGYVEGKNVALDFRWAGDDYRRLPDLAADLVRQRVSLIAAAGLNAALVSKRATATIPIVFGVGDDPVKHGLAASITLAATPRVSTFLSPALARRG
jgi:putative ABC transport system substrate-binding protein